jgi:pyrrolysine biosynthesis protein PylC
MLIAIIGGKLQGVEALYLAGKAGYKTLLIDKNPDATATRLCDQFLKFRFSLDQPIPADCPPIDLILPAIEDNTVLAALKIWSEKANIPLAFDPDAYRLSSSKLMSDELFRKLKLPAPFPWPICSFPVVVKPDQESGSQGVEILCDQESLNHYLSGSRTKSHVVIQECLDGPSYSIEVIGFPGNYRPLQVTKLHMDNDYDCKRVTAPSELSPALIVYFENMACAIAEEIKLKGIMDVEVILHDNQLKLLEIDARLPSQTPMAVYWSTGVNIVRVLCEMFVNKKTDDSPENQKRFVCIEHILVQRNELEVCGEHIMSSDTVLTLQPGFFGADEALTSYRPEKRNWVATMIFAGNSHSEISAKKKRCYEKITNL